MFVEHARARERGPEKSAVIPGFSRGRPGESVGTPGRGERGRRDSGESGGRASLYFWTEGESRERRRVRRIDASFCLNYRRESYEPPDPSPPPPLATTRPHFFLFSGPFRASSRSLRSASRRRRVYRLFTPISLKTTSIQPFYERSFVKTALLLCGAVTSARHVRARGPWRVPSSVAPSRR